MKSNISEITIQYNPIIKPKDRPKLTSSIQCYEYLLGNWDNMIYLQEVFCVMLLDQKCGVIGIKEISRGGISGTFVDAKSVFSIALLTYASSIVLAHNHPSGNLRPSAPDIDLTSNLIKCGKMLDIQVQDHLIITPEGYYSFADEGII